MPTGKYDSVNDTTNYFDDSGKFISTVPGDVTKSPLGLLPSGVIGAIGGATSSPKIATKSDGSVDWKQFVKDTLTNAASQAPLMIPGEGVTAMLLKGGGSL